MNKYEAMFIVKPDLSEEDKKTLCDQIKDAVVKNKGEVKDLNVWSEKRNLCFVIKRYREGVYYLMRFSIAPNAVSELRQAYKLNENILRVLIIKVT